MRSILFIMAIALSCKTAEITREDHKVPEIIIGGKLFTSAFQQKAAEYRALCYQAFNMARLQLDHNLKTSGSKPPAIITDIDETVLDNSAYAVQQGLQGRDYEPHSWYEWTSLGIADTVPGAPSFLQYAASRGVEIFYITNREEREREGTLRNLQRFGLPNADNAHLIMKKESSGKESRRQKVMDDFEVVMLIGDNLADFSAAFEKLPLEQRNLNTDLASGLFGSRYILLPNPVYGYWEDAIYEYERLTPQQRDSVLRQLLRSY